jgi:hypothetical protein
MGVRYVSQATAQILGIVLTLHLIFHGVLFKNVSTYIHALNIFVASLRDICEEPHSEPWKGEGIFCVVHTVHSR